MQDHIGSNSVQSGIFTFGPPTRKSSVRSGQRRQGGRRLGGGQLRRLPKKSKCLSLRAWSIVYLGGCTTVYLGDWATVYLADCATVYLGDCARVCLSDCIIVSLAFVPLWLWSLCCRDSGRLGYCDPGRLDNCDSVSLGYSDSGVWTIVNSGSCALAAPLRRYLCSNPNSETNCILWNVFLIEAKILSKTSLQVNPPSKETCSSQRDTIHRDNQIRHRRQVKLTVLG